MRKIKIGKRTLSPESPVFIVAEIGLNHNGRPFLAKQMIHRAREAGADAVKFQVYRTESFVHPRYARAQYELLKRMELPFDAVRELKVFADRAGILFFASAFDRESVDLLVRLKCPVLKAASSELSNLPLIRYMAGQKRPLFLSTGLHTWEEIKKFVRQTERVNPDLVLFYCLSEYPLRYENANLNAIRLYQDEFDHPVGFSDHSEGFRLDIMACALGVRVIEKHFTMDRRWPGPDQRISLDFRQFREFVNQVRLTEICLGCSGKNLTGDEKKIRKAALKGLYAAQSIRKGELVTAGKVRFLRPAAGTGAVSADRIIGRKAARSVNPGDPL